MLLLLPLLVRLVQEACGLAAGGHSPAGGGWDSAGWGLPPLVQYAHGPLGSGRLPGDAPLPRAVVPGETVLVLVLGGCRNMFDNTVIINVILMYP